MACKLPHGGARQAIAMAGEWQKYARGRITPPGSVLASPLGLRPSRHCRVEGNRVWRQATAGFQIHGCPLPCELKPVSPAPVRAPE